MARGKKTTKARNLRFESLENRRLLAADWGYNATFPEDVNGDSMVQPLDALLVINALTASRSVGRGQGEGEPNTDQFFVDVNHDQRLTPSDALQVINVLAESRFSPQRSGDDSQDDGSSDDVNPGADDQSDDSPVDSAQPGADDSQGDDSSDDVSPGADDQSDDSPDDSAQPGADDSLDDSSSDNGSSGEDDKTDNSSDDKTDNSGDDNADDHRQADRHSDGATTAGDVELTAQLSAAGAVRGKAGYEVETEHAATARKFEVELRDAEPETTYKVHVGAVLVGQFDTDATGRGKLEFSSSPDRDASSFPSDFPEIVAGVTVTVGDQMSGQFQLDND